MSVKMGENYDPFYYKVTQMSLKACHFGEREREGGERESEKKTENNKEL